MNPYDNYTSSSSLSGEYDINSIINWNNKYFKSFFSDLLPPNKNCRILDLGCGYGKNILALSALGYKNVTGIDFSQVQVDYANTKLKLNNVFFADAIDWLNNSDNGPFDCILAIDVLEHLDTATLLTIGNLIHRNLTYEGCLILQVPNGRSPLNHIPSGDLTHIRSFTPQSIKQFFVLSDLMPSGFYEAPPLVHGFQSFIRRIIWRLIIKPLLIATSMVMNGNVFKGDILTANIISKAKRY